jgi:hypothetical protein
MAWSKQSLSQLLGQVEAPLVPQSISQVALSLQVWPQTEPEQF